MNIQAKQKWDSLTDQQKMAFGDRWITHESNLRAWDKRFDDLSSLKKQRVMSCIIDTPVNSLNYVAA